MLHRRIAFLWPVVAALSMPAFADPDKDESGHGHRGHDREDKEEYWDGDCRVERKWEKNGEYEEERKCERRGGRRHGSDPAPAVIAYPPWIVVQQGEPTYRRGYEPARPRGDVFQCHRDEVGQVLGGIIGGLLGNQIGSGSGRAVATVGGAVAGALIGGEIGRRIDARDQACIGQALEYAPPGHRVEWSGGSSTYALVPDSVTTRNGRYCRSYEAEVMAEQGPQRVPGVACRRSDGSWAAAGQAR